MYSINKSAGENLGKLPNLHIAIWTMRREANDLYITQLRYFSTIAQLENVSQAAKLLHLSQSSLSKNLARLESEVGMHLFNRSGKKLTLNAAGARLLEYSNLALRELEYALDDMRLLSTGADSRVKIGTAGASDRLAGCIAAFHQEHPEAEFDLNSGIEGIEHLDINDFDMLLYPAGGKYDKFTGFPLYEDRCYLAVSRSHPLADCGAVLPRAEKTLWSMPSGFAAPWRSASGPSAMWTHGSSTGRSSPPACAWGLFRRAARPSIGRTRRCG